jgi:hypothetical protein
MRAGVSVIIEDNACELLVVIASISAHVVIGFNTANPVG